MTKPKEPKETAKKPTTKKKAGATDKIVELVLQNPKASNEKIVTLLQNHGFEAKPATISSQAFHTRKIMRILADMKSEDAQKAIAGFRE